jgi:hypothetical protein
VSCLLKEKTPARDHGQDDHEMTRAADRLDHHAHLLRRLHDGEFARARRGISPRGRRLRAPHILTRPGRDPGVSPVVTAGRLHLLASPQNMSR